MKTYTITRSELIDLLMARIELQILENAGVDSWEWYGEAFSEYEDAYDEMYEEAANIIEIDFEEV